ncbi:hypothetical protein [Bacteroides cellulosilyticus]|uniref:hypothetical protein n=1 Tax=Bacteroides cellulosilyticus TaxID=246787 RepID=UPI0032C1BD63
MGRPKKEATLSERVMKNEAIDYSEYSQKQLIECIGELKTKAEEKKTAIITDKDLKDVKKYLEKAFEKLNGVSTEAPTTTPNS